MSQEEKIVSEFILEGLNFDVAGAASSKIKRKLQQVGVKPEVIRRVAISAYEAEINVIIHAYSGIIRAAIFSERTEILVEDKGPGIADVSLAMQEGFSTATDEIRAIGFGAGMGLPNMLKCSDKFEITSEVGIGTRINMIFYH